MSLLSPIVSPYMLDEQDTIENYYQRYLHDPAGSIERNGKVYYRIISSCFFLKNNEKHILCNIDSNLNCKVGQELMDENGHRFTFLSTVRGSFRNRIPDWYIYAPQYELKGDPSEIGEYLTLAD